MSRTKKGLVVRVDAKWFVVSVYAFLAAVGATASILMHGRNPFLHPSPSIVLSPFTRECVSLVVGVGFALFVVLLSQLSIRWTKWGSRLAEDLRPVALQLSSSMVVATALLSSLGEELLFRSFLVPWIGVIPQSVVFGLLHQIPGPSRWVWAIFATITGAALGELYATLGSLSGAIAAHAIINALNLKYLRKSSTNASIANRIVRGSE